MISREALFAYVESGTLPSGPLTVHVDIINRCNLRCPSCWNHSPLVPRKKPDRDAVLDMKGFERIRSELKAAGVGKVMLSGGGEPFLHPGIYAMISGLKDAGMHVTVLSNGMLIDPLRIERNPPDRIILNYCASRQAEDRALHRDLLERINRTVPLSLVLVTDSTAVDQVIPLVEAALDFPDIQVTFKPASLSAETVRLALSGEDREKLLNTILPRVRELCENRGIPHNIGMFEDQLAGTGPAGDASETGCYAGIFYSRIYVNGDVFFCCAHIKTGNLYESSFAEIWKSEKYRAIRNSLKEGRFFPCCSQCGKYNLNYRAAEMLKGSGR
ncbi:MAG: radical SAM protein [Spirochaetales bacterium]|nr:MAG: radical SAM protein [Spirochaetales bacterium]